MVWDQEALYLLRQLWTEGHSTTEIGRRMGVSKNSIVGKAHRMDLDGRPSPIIRHAADHSRKPVPSVPRPKFTLPPFGSIAVLPAPIASAEAASYQQPFRGAAAVVQALAQTPKAKKPVFAAPPPQPTPAPLYRKSFECCWPVGEPGTKTFRFCDGISIPGKPYCDTHAKRAYVRVRDRAEDAA